MRRENSIFRREMGRSAMRGRLELGGRYTLNPCVGAGHAPQYTHGMSFLTRRW